MNFESIMVVIAYDCSLIETQHILHRDLSILVTVPVKQNMFYEKPLTWIYNYIHFIKCQTKFINKQGHDRN